MTIGGRNLVVLGVLSCAIAVATAGVSLAIYHNTGDIYLDRSRPGFLPDEEEIEKDEDKKENEDFNFSASGKITKEVLEEYLTNLQLELDAIESYQDPFGEEALSNNKLGIGE